MADKTRDGKVKCSFCKKTEDQVRKLISGPDGVYICDECIGICAEIIRKKNSHSTGRKSIMTQRLIC